MKTEEEKAKERAYEIVASLSTNGHLDSSITAEKATELLASMLKEYRERTDKYAVSLSLRKDDVVLNQIQTSTTPVLEIVNARSGSEALGKTINQIWNKKPQGAAIHTFAYKTIES